MRVFYSERLTIPLPDGHRFPVTKYRMLREALVRDRVLQADEICPAPMATREQLLWAHGAAYVDSILDGSVDPKILKRIGFPWNEGLVLRSLATVGGAIASALAALEEGVSGNLAGGTHHAHADSGEGYCVFNDQAIVALGLLDGRLAARPVRRVSIVDLDVHQGNGNSSILRLRPDVFVLSLHGERNYPFRKVPSSLDVGLPDQTGDDAYLSALRSALPRAFEFAPDLVLYQAGVDPLAQDTLGRLALSFAGLRERDRLVLEACRMAGIPVSLAMGGGYARPIELTVQAHVNTYRAVKEVFAGPGAHAHG